MSADPGLDLGDLDPEDARAIRALLPPGPTTQEDVWRAMDAAWDALGCDNLHPTPESLDAFYQHPVWLLNGLYIEQDETSLSHRRAIAEWVARRAGVEAVLDFGGGFGTFARILAEKAPRGVAIDVFEPKPAALAVRRAAAYPAISFVDHVERQYDVLVTTDVLEHVPDPLATLAELIGHVRPGGHLVIANCFHPVIKCHLPHNFHLRYGFDRLAASMGLRPLGPCVGSHARIYHKPAATPLSWTRIRALERLSRAVFPALAAAARLRARLRRLAR